MNGMDPLAAIARRREPKKEGRRGGNGVTEKSKSAREGELVGHVYEKMRESEGGCVLWRSQAMIEA